MSRILYFMIFLLILTPSLACSPRATSYVHPNVDFSFIHRVAIFPFQNMSQDTHAAARIQSIFMAGILEQEGIILVDQGEVLYTLQKLNISPASILSAEQIKALGQQLAVEGIFFGTVEEYGMARIGNDQVYIVTAAFSLAETETGSLIWNAQVSNDGTSFRRRLFGGGTASLYEVSSSAVKAAQRTLF
jgi:hypothetical protein